MRKLIVSTTGHVKEIPLEPSHLIGGRLARPTKTTKYRFDENKFEAVVRRERDAMASLAAQMLGASEDAEDIVQDAFAQLYLHWDTVNNAGGYVRRSVVNACLRSRSRRQKRDQLLELLRPSRTDRANNPQDRVDSWDAVRRALSPEELAIVFLKVGERMQYDEIADLLRTPTGTVKSKLHRALTKLRNATETD